jgi:hypothetical protein
MLTLVAADAIRVPDLHDHICTTGRTMLRDDKPSEYLAIELNEVRRDGTALLEHLTHQTNLQFPPDFPKEALTKIASSLLVLPKGTASGCRKPLLYAQTRLAEIRGSHIRGDEHLPIAGNGDDHPTPLRAGPLDTRVTA